MRETFETMADKMWSGQWVIFIADWKFPAESKILKMQRFAVTDTVQRVSSEKEDSSS